MMEFLERAFRNVLMFGQQMMTGENVWIVVLIMLIATGAVFAMRGRLTESWLWLPVLALAIWYAIYRLLKLRA